MKRYVKDKGADKGARRDITFPWLMSDYKLNIHGTDIMDQILAAYQIGIESRKYYMNVFNWIQQVFVAKSWLLHQKSCREKNLT